MFQTKMFAEAFPQQNDGSESYPIQFNLTPFNFKGNQEFKLVSIFFSVTKNHTDIR
jgi:hypothetical protein